MANQYQMDVNAQIRDRLTSFLEVSSGVSSSPCPQYSSRTVRKFNFSEPYYVYSSLSTISNSFFGVNRNSIDSMISAGIDFGLLFISYANGKFYFYDKQQALNLLSKVSTDSTYGNYKIVLEDLSNPIDAPSLAQRFATL